MYWKASILVIANRTVGSPELLHALEARCERGPTAFTILAPTPRSEREDAQAELETAVEALRAAGLDADGRLGDVDPIVAVGELWNPADFDEVIVSTLPTQASKWLQIDLPHRVARMTGATVTHVVASAREPVLG
jgi:hypothetical protein